MIKLKQQKIPIESFALCQSSEWTKKESCGIHDKTSNAERPASLPDSDARIPISPLHFQRCLFAFTHTATPRQHNLDDCGLAGALLSSFTHLRTVHIKSGQYPSYPCAFPQLCPSLWGITRPLDHLIFHHVIPNGEETPDYSAENAWVHPKTLTIIMSGHICQFPDYLQRIQDDGLTPCISRSYSKAEIVNIVFVAFDLYDPRGEIRITREIWTFLINETSLNRRYIIHVPETWMWSAPLEAGQPNLEGAVNQGAMSADWDHQANRPGVQYDHHHQKLVEVDIVGTVEPKVRAARAKDWWWKDDMIEFVSYTPLDFKKKFKV